MLKYPLPSNLLRQIFTIQVVCAFYSYATFPQNLAASQNVTADLPINAVLEMSLYGKGSISMCMRVIRAYK